MAVDPSRYFGGSSPLSTAPITPPQNAPITPPQNITPNYSGVSRTVVAPVLDNRRVISVGTELEPLNFDILSPQEKQSLREHRLSDYKIHLEYSHRFLVIISIFAFFTAPLFAISLYFWSPPLFAIPLYFWSLYILSKHNSIFKYLPRTQDMHDMQKVSSWIRFVPVVNLLFIPFSQDELRRHVNLQNGLRGKERTSTRTGIKIASILTCFGFLFAASGLLSLLIDIFYYSDGDPFGYDEYLFFSVIMMLFAISIIVQMRIMKSHLFVKPREWWPDTSGESKDGSDLFHVDFMSGIIILFLILLMPSMGTLLDIHQVDLLGFSFFFIVVSIPLVLILSNRENFSRSLYVKFIFVLLFIALFYSFLVDQYSINWYRSMELEEEALVFSMVPGFIMMLFGCIVVTINEYSLRKSLFELASETSEGFNLNQQIINDQSVIKNPDSVSILPDRSSTGQIGLVNQSNSQLGGGESFNISSHSNINLGNFARKHLIAQGGMSDVFMARDISTNMDVAWKQAHNRFNPLHSTNAKLVGEADLLQKINHPRLPKFIGITEINNEQGNSCGVLIQEFIEGGDLKSTIEQIKKMGMDLPLEKISEIMIQVCEPLIYMSNLPEPIYHRDLKPHNIIVHPIRGAMLIDFGLAKMVASVQDMSITRGGSGTWSPPERDSGISGPFTDVYSLGKILYYLCTSQQPPVIMTHSEKAQIIQKGYPEWLANLMLSAAWPRHEERLNSVGQFAQALANEGHYSQVSQSVSGSDDFTTWG